MQDITMKNQIIIHEVGMRDGLQMEKQTVPLEKKLEWIDGTMHAGVDIIQVGSFVHPTKVPQMADTDRLFAELMKPGRKPENVILSGLVLNEKGLERGLTCGVEMFCMGVSASETHSQKNTGMSIAEATDRIIVIARTAKEAGRRVQVSVQSAFGCGYEGNVPQERVEKIVQRFLDAGLRNISLADTAGHATPDKVEQMFSAILESGDGVECACHFHNTYGLALANCYAAMKVGVKYFESSIAGLGGCPFTKIAGGNVSTEDFVHALQRMGLRHDVHLEALIALATDVSRFFAREMPGTVYKTGPIPQLTETEHQG
jgi:hydroxymethylglutaryl-CoA lyase